MTPDDGVVGDPIDILLVEPNPGDARLFTESFADGKLANALHVVTSAAALRDFLHRRGEYADAPRPNIVLLEPRLPGGEGDGLLAELKDAPVLSDVPIVVLTSSDAGEEIARSRDEQADHYVQKPVGPEEFITFVQSIEDFWLAIVEQPSADD